MRPVSEKQKLKFGIKCFICGKEGEQHHPLMYAGRQIDEISIPLCKYHHRGNNGTIWKDVKDKCEKQSIQNSMMYLKITYPKFDWEQRYKYLCTLF